MKWIVSGLVLFVGLVQAAFLSRPIYQDVLIKGIPHIAQKPDFCGEACAAMYLRKLGYEVDQDYIFDMSGVDPTEARGSYTPELAVALKKIGFNIGTVGSWVSAAKAERETELHWQALHADLLNGIPSIVCTRYSGQKNSPEHFRLVLGYDGSRDEVIYHEPAEKNGAYHRIKLSQFLNLWPLKYRRNKWYIVRLRLEPAGLRVRPISRTHTDADYAQHIMQLKRRAPGFTILVQKPFVVIGDEPPTVLKTKRAQGTVKWAVDRFKEKYFDHDPTQIIDIWLFKDKSSYRRHTRRIFGHHPDTPFGYFSSAENALIMNIETGGGTLVHEMFHAFMAGNFPQSPAWFNEAYASLYEQSGSSVNGIAGLTNWRLPYLQEHIRRGTLPSFKRFCSQSDHQFYQGRSGDNYAQGRYLALYLQAKGLLVRYYDEFRKNRKEDATGYQTLKRVLGEGDMEVFQKKWENWVVGLKFPPSYAPTA